MRGEHPSARMPGSCSGTKGRIRSHMLFAISSLSTSMRPLSRKAISAVCFCLASSNPCFSPQSIHLWHSSADIKFWMAEMRTGCSSNWTCPNCIFNGTPIAESTSKVSSPPMTASSSCVCGGAKRGADTATTLSACGS